MTVKRVIKGVARRLPPGSREWTKRRYHAWRKPLVSVVLPAYNVEAYIGQCLDSLLAQTYTHFEVIVVDDGSPDSSGAIAADYARRDSRVRVHTQTNAGLGGARNSGANQARGDYLWFVDSDDVVPVGALGSMMSTLLSSGSDFVVGSLAHMNGTRLSVPPWAQRVHSTPLTSTTLNEHPEVLKNVFAWSKLFNIDFYRDHVAPFPVGLYEDQVPSTRAYASGTFDVIPDVVLHWRQREDSSSITQQKTSIRDLSERWAAIEGVADVLEVVDPTIRSDWHAKVIGFDMRPYYQAVPRADDEYWTILSQHVRLFLDTHGDEVLTHVPILDRLPAAAASLGYREDLTAIAVLRDEMTWKLPCVVVGSAVEIHEDYFEGLNLTSADVGPLLDRDVEVVHDVSSIEMTATHARIEGFAYLSMIDLSRAGTTSSIRVVATPEEGAPVAVRVDVVDSADAEMGAHDPWNSHLKSGFRVDIPLADLPATSYTFHVEVSVGEVSRTGALTRPRAMSHARFPAFSPAEPTGRWCVRDLPGLVIERIDPTYVPVSAVEMDGTTVTFHLATSDSVVDGIFRASNDKSTIRGQFDAGTGAVTFNLGRRNAPMSKTKWWFTLQRPGTNQRERLTWQKASSDLEAQGPSGILLRANQYGSIVAETAPRVGEITSVNLTDTTLEVEGWVTYSNLALGAPVLALVTSSQQMLAVADIEWLEETRFRAELPLKDQLGMAWSKVPGHALAICDDAGEYWPSASLSLAPQFPARTTNNALALDLSTTPRAGAVWANFRSLFTENERGRYRQALLSRQYRDSKTPLRNAAFFESFAGRTIGDSPLGISHELARTHPDIEQLWSVDCLTRAVPNHATPVLRYSKRWYEALATSRWLVNNNNWPAFFDKKPGQTYLQTWHGTPLKRIGKHVPATNLSMSYRTLMTREATQWDFLLAQNDFAADVLPDALEYRGQTLREGYPRNDILSDSTAQERRVEVRKLLGIKDDQRAVLYAPTWRDNVRGASGYGRVSYIDVESFTRTPLDTADRVVLYRGHSNTSGAPATQPAGFIDVTSYSDVNDLMLAADCLVTDYSSIMFDFAVTKKPIYFLVPDLDQYSGVTRGFYLDLASIAPGPLCANTEELATALASDYWDTWADKYQAFVDRFASRDDGAASQRVVAEVFPPAQA